MRLRRRAKEINMSKIKYTPPLGPFDCYFNCGSVLESKNSLLLTDGWEWFTGYGDRTIHFCLKCRKKKQFEINKLRNLVDNKPEGYPKVMVKTPNYKQGDVDEK